MIAGKDAPTHGEAKNSWLTGTAAWNFVAISQWILGIRPEHDGLRIDPVLPADWGDFTVTPPVPRRHVQDHRPQGRRVRPAASRGSSWTAGRSPGNLVPLPARAGRGVVEVEAFVEVQSEAAR